MTFCEKYQKKILFNFRLITCKPGLCINSSNFCTTLYEGVKTLSRNLGPSPILMILWNNKLISTKPFLQLLDS